MAARRRSWRKAWTWPTPCRSDPTGCSIFRNWPRARSAASRLMAVPLERLVDGLAVPTAVKFDNHGHLLVIQAFTGEVTRVDIQSRQTSRVAMLQSGTRQPGRHSRRPTLHLQLYRRHHHRGGAQRHAEKLPSARDVGTRRVSTCTDDGRIYTTDFMAILKVIGQGKWERVGWSFDADFPGFLRDLCPVPATWFIPPP